MGSLDIWGAIAASVLLVQCLIFNLVNLALAAGLWYGVKWLRGRSQTGLLAAGRLMKQGQEIVVKDGYFPIPATIAKEEIAKVE